MISLANFRARFPEFVSAGDTLVNATLTGASLAIDADVWGDLTDEGHAYLTAHMLATAPNGQNARLESDKAESTYGKRYRELVSTVAYGYRVI